MTPYYQDPWITLWHADNRDILPTLADQSIDLVLTDPPYGTTQLEWDVAVDWAVQWLALYRVCTTSALQVVFSAQPFTTDLIVSNRANYRYELIWPKPMSTGFFAANQRPLRAHENILIFCQNFGRTTYNPQKIAGAAYKHAKRGVSQHYDLKTSHSPTFSSGDRYPTTVLPPFVNYNGGNGGNGDHPTAKPLPLMCWLVATYSNPSDLLFDGFAGSGTTGVAAKRLGRRCILVEQDEHYCEIAAKRLSQDCMNLEVA